MKNTWFTGVAKNDPSSREERRQVVLSGKPALDVLTQILSRRVQEKQRTRDSEEFQSEYQYSVHQAKCAGELRALRDVLSLLDLKEE